MNIEALSEEERLKRDKSLYPPFIVRSLAEVREEIRIEKKTGKSIPYHPTKITDFTPLIHCIWKISSKAYQEEFWGKQGQWGDNFMETMETFLGDAEAVLKANIAGRVLMDPKQREMLQELYDKIDWFLEDPEAPYSEYGESDESIINDPKWQKIGEYSKLVYEEISGDDLDEWENENNISK